MTLKSHIILPCFFILSFILFSCTEEDDKDKHAPKMVTSVPYDGEIDVDTSQVIRINFTEQVFLSQDHKITINGIVVNATTSHRDLLIEYDLLPGQEYTLIIPENSVRDENQNYSQAITIKFSTKQTLPQSGSIYEAEHAILKSGAAVNNTLPGFSGTGYVSSGDGYLTFSINAEFDGYFDLSIRYSNSNSKKVNDLYIDDVRMASITFSAVADWNTVVAGKIKLKKGSHAITIAKNWGWTNYDYIKLEVDSDFEYKFSLNDKLVTKNPSVHAVKLYDFLLNNFGKKVLSGAAAAHSTNIDEAVWIHDNTGKWPAITCFDFLDHTKKDQSWVKYDAPLELSKEWWKNNGIVALMWHWRDPLTKTGSFYTSETSFDVSRINDTTSLEYKAMIADIDVISEYLKKFRDAAIPVLWRPLHEASGAWFWWGAKGATHCKTLWKLMFNRMTEVHGLNNLIWVWTSDVDAGAYDWYPGDEFVDVIGMDIYPGENQHGSQYFSFIKIMEIFSGKKLITLSECGSVPDPALMKEYGDMWSYFMPWNGDFTRSDKHNGVEWWKKLFSYDFVITRDLMPDLK